MLKEGSVIEGWQLVCLRSKGTDRMAQTSPYEKISLIDGICNHIKRFNIT